MENISFYAVLALCGLSAVMLYSGGSLFGLAAASVIVGAVYALAVFVYRRYVERMMFGGILGIVYLVMIDCIAAFSLVRFSLFLGGFTHVSMRFAGFIGAMLAAAVFASKRGAAAVSAAALILLCIMGGIGVFSALPLAFHVSWDNFLSGDLNADDILYAAASGITSAAAIPCLFSQRVSLKKGAYVRIFAAVFAAIAVFSVLSLGVLGGYSRLVRFPFYAAAQSAGVRLDAVFLCAVTFGEFALLSLVFCSVRAVTNNSKAWIAALPVPMAAAVYFSVEYDAIGDILSDSRILCAFTLVAAFVMPIAASMKFRVRAWRTAAVSCLCVCLMLSLCGCDKLQLNRRLIVKGLGIDRLDDNIILTAQYIDNYADGDKQTNLAVSVTGKTVSEAIGRLKDSSGSEPFLGQNAAIVFGSSAAADMGEYLSYLINYSESPPTARLYISETTAKDILTLNQGGELVPIDHITGISPSEREDDFTVLDAAQAIVSPTDTLSAAVLKIEDERIVLSTVGYINGDSLIGLDEKDYLSYCLLCSPENESMITVNGVTCKVTKSKVKINADYSNNRLYFRIKCIPEMSILENTRGYSSAEISEMFSSQLEYDIKSSLRRLLNDEQCDIFGLGRRLSPIERRKIGSTNEYRKLLANSDFNLIISSSTKVGFVGE